MNVRPLAILTAKERKFWNVANKEVLWGWKRNSRGLRRLVYFHGSLSLKGNALFWQRFVFLYSTTLPLKDSPALLKTLDLVKSKFYSLGIPVSIRQQTAGSLIEVSLTLGLITANDRKNIQKLTARKPKKHIRTARHLRQSPLSKIEQILPADLYIGSGVSYESGILMAYQVHDMFTLDNYETGDFTTGISDPLPNILLREGMGRVNKFATVHIQALKVQPNESMRIVAQLVKAGLIKKVFTDNVDNLLSKLRIPFERVRGSGIYNERYNAKFATKNLIVVGVGADRRQIVRQARGRHMKIIVVNPVARVSLRTTHLEYLKKSDLFFKMKAQNFFEKIESLVLRNPKIRH